MTMRRCNVANGTPSSSRVSCWWQRLGLLVGVLLLAGGEPLKSAEPAAESAQSWQANRGSELRTRIADRSPGTPATVAPIEVKESNNCPPQNEAFVPDELRKLNVTDLYAELDSYCRQRFSAPVGIVWRIRRKIQSTAGEPEKQVPCSRLAIRQYKDAKTLRIDRQPVATGMKLCERDLLVTWQGVELDVQFFRKKKGGEPGYAERTALRELSRLRLGVRQSELVEGRLGQFTDPDYPDIVTALGQTNKVAARPGTYIELEVTDTCTGQGTITVPKQEGGAPGEQHQVSVCESVDGALKCQRAPIEEGERQAILPGAPGAEPPDEIDRGLREAEKRYQVLKDAARADKIELPKLDGDYVKPPEPGVLRVEVKPAGAQLWVNGESVQTRKGVFERTLPPGTYVLVARLGSETKTEIQELGSGQRRNPVLDLSGQLPFGLEWVNVPAGEFTMGSNDGADDEKPPHKVKLSAFKLSKTEVTVAQYDACVQAGKCTEPNMGGDCNWKVAGRENHPINCVDWDQAKAFTVWLSKVSGQDVRLPSEAQWEYAARGPKGRKYPWGSTDPTQELANYNMNVKSTTPVGEYPKGASWVGALDLAGNVWEWCLDSYAPYKDNDKVPVDPVVSIADSSRVLRGGAWHYGTDGLRGANRFRIRPGYRDGSLGFRVVCVSVSAEHGLDLDP